MNKTYIKRVEWDIEEISKKDFIFSLISPIIAIYFLFRYDIHFLEYFMTSISGLLIAIFTSLKREVYYEEVKK